MDDRCRKLPLMMQGTKDDMTDLLVDVCDDMGIICSSIVVCLQMDPVNE